MTTDSAPCNLMVRYLASARPPDKAMAAKIAGRPTRRDADGSLWVHLGDSVK